MLQGLDGIKKAGIVTNGLGVPWNHGAVQGHHSRIRASASILSEVLYEHWLERCRASRGATQVWVAVPGARRRVFYFAAVISSE